MAILDGLRTKYVFIDESGNTSIATDKDGTSKLYVATAVIIDEEKIYDSYAKAKEIREKFLNNHPIKSTSVKKDYRRLNVLKEIIGIDFNYIFIVIDKELIIKDSGLSFRGSFYKYFASQLYKHFFNIFCKFKIYIDNFGDREAQENFKKYLDKKFDMGLFNEPEVNYLSGRDDDLIGIADFISGSIRLILENKIDEKRNEIINLIRGKNLYGERWPEAKENENFEDLFQGFNYLIKSVSIRNANNFISQNINSKDENIRMQVAILIKLKSEITLDSEDRKGLYSSELIDYLQELNFPEITDRTFRQNIIGPLRDAGILISGSNKGYYLATDIIDIKKFLEHGNKIILPMLNRLDKARDTLKIASDGKCDIFDKQIGEFKTLQIILETLKEKKIGFDNESSQILEEKLNEIEQKEQGQNVSTEKLSK